MEFKRPSRTQTESGRERKLGFEIEFCGAGLRRAAQVIQQLFGGEIRDIHRFAFQVKSTRFGDFEVDSDSSFLTKRKWQSYLDLMGAMSLNATVEDIVASVTENLVPFEIATPPIPFSKIEVLDDLRGQLRLAGAIGTHAHFFTAFGMQFNPEVPSTKVETLLGYMRAYFLRLDELLESEDIPMARKVMPFIDPFPSEYIELVLDPAYKPSLNGFMRDYLEQNPTRNRSLDWLPLFAHINRDLVFEYPVEKELVKPRPTFHYRLPSSLIDDPRWTIASEWNKWVEIEDLAARLSQDETALKNARSPEANA